MHLCGLKVSLPTFLCLQCFFGVFCLLTVRKLWVLFAPRGLSKLDLYVLVHSGIFGLNELCLKPTQSQRNPSVLLFFLFLSPLLFL